MVITDGNDGTGIRAAEELCDAYTRREDDWPRRGHPLQCCERKVVMTTRHDNDA
jgi:hypothetical protein